MLAEQFDVIIRVAGVCLLLMLAAALIRDARQERLIWFFIPLALCLCGFLAGNTPDLSVRLSGAPGTLAHMLSGYTAVFLWWFCLAIFDREFRPAGPELVVGLAWLVIASADRGLLGPNIADKGLSWLLVAIGFGMVSHLAWRLVRDREGDLIERRREARIMVAILLVGQLLIDLSVDLAFGFGWRPRSFAIGQNAAILTFAGWLSSLLLRANVGALMFRTPVNSLVAANIRAQQGDEADNERRLTERLRRLIEVERVHLDPELTFGAFVERMGASERTVRWLVNHRLGHDHFRVFLNVHRMEEARRLLGDPGRAGEKLISIAHDSGFASLASFNRVFRTAEGRTPSEYRAAALNQLPGQALSTTDTPCLGTENSAFEERCAGF